MKTNKYSQPVLMREASEALIDRLGLSKASEFWTSLGYGSKDYTKLRGKLFAKETVRTLYKKIKEFEKR